MCQTLYFLTHPAGIRYRYDKLPSFPDSWEFHFDTACYCSLLGKMKVAEEFLARAFKLGDSKALKRAALSDPNLQPLWKAFGSL
jgi:hypothetical protein